MNTQSQTRSPPLLSVRTAVTRAQERAQRHRVRSGHVETCLAHVTRRDAAHGCVDWFMYEKAEPRQ